MYFITTKRMLEVCFSAHPNIQYRTLFLYLIIFNSFICILNIIRCILPIISLMIHLY